MRTHAFGCKAHDERDDFACDCGYMQQAPRPKPTADESETLRRASRILERLGQETLARKVWAES